MLKRIPALMHLNQMAEFASHSAIKVYRGLIMTHSCILDKTTLKSSRTLAPNVTCPLV